MTDAERIERRKQAFKEFIKKTLEENPGYDVHVGFCDGIIAYELVVQDKKAGLEVRRMLDPGVLERSLDDETGFLDFETKNAIRRINEAKQEQSQNDKG